MSKEIKEVKEVKKESEKEVVERLNKGAFMSVPAEIKDYFEKKGYVIRFKTPNSISDWEKVEGYPEVPDMVLVKRKK